MEGKTASASVYSHCDEADYGGGVGGRVGGGGGGGGSGIGGGSGDERTDEKKHRKSEGINSCELGNKRKANSRRILLLHPLFLLIIIHPSPPRKIRK